MLKKLLAVSTLALLACGCSAGPHYCPYCGADLTKAPPQATAKPSSAAPAVAAPLQTTAAPVAAPIVPVAVTTATSNVIHIAPAKVFDQAQAALKTDGFTIDSAKDGIIQTGWKSYEGEYHVFRRWEEQSRFRMSVIPDINDPMGSARLDIVEETQRRSNPKANWEAASTRPERAAQVLASVQAHISGK